MKDLINLRNHKYLDFEHSFKEHPHELSLKVQDHIFSFPNISSDWIIKPNEWIINKHKNNSIHEPGLISWMLALSEFLDDKKINFVDIGALFGYFSILASSFFRESNITAIEGNPKSSQFIKRLVDHGNIENITVKNMVIGDTRSETNFLINGFEFIEEQHANTRLLKINAKNIYKKAINTFTGRNIPTETPYKTKIQQSLATDFIDPHNEVINIFKIDTEGHQASFIPPSAKKLIESNSILLMEFDTRKKLRKYGTSNYEICKPFLDAGYLLYWCDHRETLQKAEKIIKPLDKYEDNSLCVLIPSSIC